MTEPALSLIVDNFPSDSDTRIAAGDLIRTGDNAYPRYRVVATNEDRAWVRDVQDGTDHVVPIARCRKI